MTEKLKEYQVLDVLCGGTFYKVRHKVTNNLFAWKAYDCSAYSDEQIEEVSSEVKTLRKVSCKSLLKYYDTILHAPSKTLYFVVEYNCWQSIAELIALCKDSDKYIQESFVWYLLYELVRVCKTIEDLPVRILRKCLSPGSIFVNQTCELRVNCFELGHQDDGNIMLEVGNVIQSMCYQSGASNSKIKEFHYSDDLQDIITFLIDHKNANLKPDIILYHPTVLANLESLAGPTSLSDLFKSVNNVTSSESNKCDSEKAVELCRVIEPIPRKHISLIDSPIYTNVSPRRKLRSESESNEDQNVLSPSLSALALELPGYVPRCRKPINNAIKCAQKVSEDTFSKQWMSRLIALRQREESLNQRERELIAKEIINSPSTKIIKKIESQLELDCESENNGITLPPVLPQMEEKSVWSSRRRHRRTSSARPRARRKSYAYEDLDSSLSADNGDGSMIVTATKFTVNNMPRRNIFPETSKKVHFTSSNPFTESDDSVTLTFYELENVGSEGKQVPTKNKMDISQFKYLDLEKITSEKRSAMQQWNHNSPSKQPKINKTIFNDITNYSLKKTPSKSSLTSKESSTSKYSLASNKSQCSIDSGKDNVSNRTRARQSLVPLTPATEVKKPKSRKSLLPFKTPFRFKTSTKV